MPTLARLRGLRFAVFGLRRVTPSGGLFFPLVRKEEEERHAKGKGFSQSRPSLWNPFLRGLFSRRVQRLPCALPRSARPAQSRCSGECRRGLHRTSACGYAEIISFVILSEAKNLAANLLWILRRCAPQNDRWGSWHAAPTFPSARLCARRAERGVAHAHQQGAHR